MWQNFSWWFLIFLVYFYLWFLIGKRFNSGAISADLGTWFVISSELILWIFMVLNDLITVEYILNPKPKNSSHKYKNQKKSLSIKDQFIAILISSLKGFRQACSSYSSSSLLSLCRWLVVTAFPRQTNWTERAISLAAKMGPHEKLLVSLQTTESLHRLVSTHQPTKF